MLSTAAAVPSDMYQANAWLLTPASLYLTRHTRRYVIQYSHAQIARPTSTLGTL